MKLYKCLKCGKIISVIKDSSSKLVCCDKEMLELKARSIDGALEKHVPVVNINNNVIEVRVGEMEHPMIEEHYIEFIILETNKGYMIKNLEPGDKPIATFILGDKEEYVNAYAYCNLHGLWNNK